MDCNCIRGEGEYNFKIERLSNDAFLYQDLSWWNTDNNYEVPISYTVKITNPSGVESEVEIFVKTSETDMPVWNKITGDMVGDLKDGVYCIELKNCDNIYKRYFVISNKIQCCIDEMIIRGDDYEELETLLKEGIILAKFGNFKDAKYLIEQRANKIVDKNCNCYGL